MSNNVRLTSGKVSDVLKAATGVVVGNWVYKESPHSTYQATITGSGAIEAVIHIEMSNNGVNALETEAGVISLAGTTTSSDGFTTNNAPWKWCRANVISVVGSITSIDVVQGV